MITFFKYSGNKSKYSNIINSFLKTNSDTYVEPFVGSGAILFNLEKEFDKYVINDLDRNIIRIFKTFKEINYDDYINRKEEVKHKFGCIKTSKESFYNFRNWFNENIWKTDSVEEGIYLLFLANSVINSFLRFGPNGMNSCFGNRFFELKESHFDIIKSRLKKTEILNLDYKEVLKLYPNAFYFLDPPYYSQASSYSGFSVDEFKQFLLLIKDKEFLYTDIINEYNCIINNKYFIREMENTAPSTNKSKNGNLEYVFSSKPLISKLDDW